MQIFTSITDFSTFLRQLLIENKPYEDIPSVALFPLQSCESACVLIALFYLKNKALAGDFYVVKSVSPSHYWVEFNDSVVDITLDQFQPYFAPIIGSVLPHPFNESGKAQYLSAHDFLNNDEPLYLANKERFDKLFSTF